MKKCIPLFFLLLFFGCKQAYQLPNEEALLTFETAKGKKLMIAMDTEGAYLVYRYGAADQIELQYPEDLADGWDSFQYSTYMRGGGIQNEGMDLNYLFFDRGEYRYVVFQEYYASSDTTEYGIKVINTRTEKETLIAANPRTVKGSLIGLRSHDKVRKSELLF